MNESYFLISPTATVLAAEYVKTENQVVTPRLSHKCNSICAKFVPESGFSLNAKEATLRKWLMMRRSLQEKIRKIAEEGPHSEIVTPNEETLHHEIEGNQPLEYPFVNLRLQHHVKHNLPRNIWTYLDMASSLIHCRALRTSLCSHR